MKNKELLGICIFIICLFPLTLNAANYRAFSAKPFSENEVRFIFLGSSGVVLNSAAGAVVIDPATLLDDYDLDQLKTANVVLIVFTHSHGDHFDSGTAVKLFKATGAHILADAMVVGILEGKIPRDRLINGLNGKTYGFGKIAVDVIQGKHGSLINLYRITMDRVRVFHGGDSGYVLLKNYPSDIAFVPTGIPSPSASPLEAIKMVLDLKPGVAVTMHGAEHQLHAFEEGIHSKLPNTRVIIPVKHVLKSVIIND